jgi:predicted O-linked N-acetylglucosamine transferase (SPINDLY family)
MWNQVQVNLQEKFAQAISLHQQGKLQEARTIYESIIKVSPKHFDALHLLGVVSAQSGNHQLAADLIGKAIAINPGNAGFYLNRGNALQALQQLEPALASFDKAIKLQPTSAVAHFNRGNVLQALGRYETAVSSYDQAINLRQDSAEFYYNRGNAFQLLNKHEAAVADYQRAVRIKPDFVGAHFNCGNALQSLRRLNDAIACYDRAIAAQPDCTDAYSNRGNAFYALKQLDAAVASYDQAIRCNPAFPEVHHNRGVALQTMQRLDEALISFDEAFRLNPDHPYLSGLILHTRMRVCMWDGFEARLADLSSRIERNLRCAASFLVLTLIDSAELQRKSAEVWMLDKHPASDVLGSIPKRARSPKIRIGYYSADFHNHATTWLMAELFERHDRSRFELIGFSFGPDRQDEMRQRVSAAFDRFIDVRMKSDQEVAQLSRLLGIDIAVDLKGYTQDNRMGIFSYRAAPVQVSYLGYPGTVGAPYMDYLIADRTLVPEHSQQHYSEKIVYLPGSYQVNDRQRRISERIYTKAEVGLPEQGFVFCCFNNNYKITPVMFDSWVRILNAVPGSVLWLFEDNATAATNLRKEAEQRGLDTKRLVFAKRMELSEHLARHRLADLFLDTLPCNAHTTASDALWAGLPVLTQVGESFAARVAASLLNAIGLPELITQTQEQYESLAIELARNPVKLSGLKEKLQQNRLTTPLFDTELYTRNLETAYRAIYERYQADLPPEHICLSDQKVQK